MRPAGRRADGVGGDVPPRVTYFTGTWDPAREAISKEIEVLRVAQPLPSQVVAFSPGNRTGLPARGVVTLGNKRWILLRALARLRQLPHGINHVFGTFGAWYLLRVATRRPTVFTIVGGCRMLELDIYGGVSVFAPESEPLAVALRDRGVPESRVRLVYPGVDLTAYAPGPPLRARPFRLLFASTPSSPAAFEERGIPLLVEAARRVPHLEVVLPWRRWGDEAATTAALRALDLPSNVRVEHVDVTDMPALYRSVHVVATLFEAGAGKACPNSIVEGLASGRPSLVSTSTGIAGLIERAGAGVATGRSVEEVLRAVERLAEGWSSFARQARALAEEVFDVRRFVREYAEIYRTLA